MRGTRLVLCIVQFTAAAGVAQRSFGAKQGAVRHLQDESGDWGGTFNHDCTVFGDAKLKMNVARAWAKLKQINTNGDDTLAWKEYQHAFVDKFKDDPLEHQMALERNKKRSVDTDIDPCCPSLTCARMR
jgi:hypothetical protein